MKILNTLPFDPKYKGAEKIVPAKARGSVIIDDNGVVTKGADIIGQIKNDANNVYLVNKFVFEHLKAKGIKNIAMFDPTKTVYGTLPNGKEGAVAQGGLIFG